MLLHKRTCTCTLLASTLTKCIFLATSLSLRGVGTGGWSAYSITSGSIATQCEVDGLANDAGAGTGMSVETEFNSFHGTAKGAFERGYTVSIYTWLRAVKTFTQVLFR